MSSPHEDEYDEDELTEEQERMVAAFQEQLGAGVSFDVDAEQNFLTTEDLIVPITQEQADEYSNTVYQVALAKVLASRPKPPSKVAYAAGWIVGLSATSVVVALAAAAIRALLF